MNKTAFFAFFILLKLLLPFKVLAQQFDYKENAVYIYNFIKYTDWSTKKTNILIGVVGKSPVEDELKSLFVRKKNNSINYIVRNIDLDDCKKFDVIIVSKSANDKVKAINKFTEKMPILIITEKENMSRSGACISFFINEDNDYKTEYQLSLKNCKQRGLTINSQIISNAELTR